MHNGSFLSNPYAQGIPGDINNKTKTRFLKPSPPYRQNFIPHHTSTPTRHNSSTSSPSSSPDLINIYSTSNSSSWRSPYVSPVSGKYDKSPRNQFSKFYSNSSSPRNNSSNMMTDQSFNKIQKASTLSKSNADCNPGGSDDLSKYFHPSMLEDPWKDLQPVMTLD